MLEALALKKWCPFVRAIMYPGADDPNGGAAHNRAAFADRLPKDDVLNPEFSHCIGSECMMWRWHYPAETRGNNGYCGLAGTPEILT